MTDVSISIYHDMRRKNEKGIFPIKLRVYYRGETRLYPTGIRISEQDFHASYTAVKPRGEQLKVLKLKMMRLEANANAICESINVFSFERFERKLLRPVSEKNSVFAAYEAIIATLRAQGRIGTASNYAMSCRSLKQFQEAKASKRTTLRFEDVTVPFLQDFERWMLYKGCSISTVGIYLRPFRALFNAAIEEGEVDRDAYPFGKRRYQIPTSRNIKKALTKKELKALFEFQTDDPFLQKARAFWFFSYVCNGMNTRDIVHLQYKTLSGDTLSFVRHKTKHTTRAYQKPIIVVLTPFAQEVIVKYGNPKESEETFVFPILSAGMTVQEQFGAAQAFTRFINQHIKRLARMVGVTEQISSYWARHSFSTIAVHSGASLEFVQESLGHNSINTTKHYFAGFADSAKRAIANKLLDFNS